MRTLVIGLAVLLLAGNAWAAIRFYPDGAPEVDYASPYTFTATTVGNLGVGAQANTKTLLFAYQTLDGSCLFYQTGGTITNVTGGQLELGYLEYAGTVITYALSGGSMTTAGSTDLGTANTPNLGSFTLAVSGTGSYSGGGTARIGDGAAGTATLAVSGSGSVSLNNYVQLGDGNSYVQVTGGNASISFNTPWTGGNTGTGVYAVGGLDFTLDANGTNISPIVCGDNFDLSNAGNAGVIDMALSGFTPAQDQVFDIITSTGTIYVPTAGVSALLDAGDVGTWSLAIVGGSDKLQATYLLPEPATMALLGLGGLGLLLRRRR